MTLLDFSSLFAEFSAASWGAWKGVLARLTPDVREFYCVVGRGAGKSRISALLACWYASRDYQRAAGESIYVGIFAPDRKQAGITLRYVLGLLRSVPALDALIVRTTTDSVELSNGIVIEVITASTAAPRGRAYAAAVIEEAAFLPTDQSSNPDVELVRAIRPALARVPNSLLVVVSSPYARRGVIWSAWQKYSGKPTAGVVFVQASTLELNPCFDAEAVAKAYEDDPSSASAEFGGMFRTDVETFITREAIAAVVVPGRIELPRVAGVRYRAFLDFAGGALGGDSATLGISHAEQRDGRSIAVLDLTREFQPPFSPESVCSSFAETLKAYGITSATADRWAAGFVIEAMRGHGVRVEPSERSKSELYAEMLPQLNSGRCELLDNARLVAQLAGLERRTARGGRDSIDHSPGGHDDLVNCAAGSLVLVGLAAAAAGNFRTVDVFTGAIVTGRDAEGNVWRDGSPWTGLFAPQRNSKGQPLGLWSRFEAGVFVGYESNGPAAPVAPVSKITWG